MTNEEKRRRLRELGDWHAEWSARAAADPRTGFHPEQHPKPGSDYNLHEEDLDAPTSLQDEFHRRARQIMGLDPETGRRLPEVWGPPRAGRSHRG